MKKLAFGQLVVMGVLTLCIVAITDEWIGTMGFGAIAIGFLFWAGTYLAKGKPRSRLLNGKNYAKYAQVTVSYVGEKNIFLLLGIQRSEDVRLYKFLKGDLRDRSGNELTEIPLYFIPLERWIKKEKKWVYYLV